MTEAVIFVMTFTVVYLWLIRSYAQMHRAD